MDKEELEYQLEKLQVEVASLKLRIKTIKRRRKQESAKRRLLQQRIDKAIEYIEENIECNKYILENLDKEKKVQLVTLLDNEIRTCEYILSILRGEEE